MGKDKYADYNLGNSIFEGFNDNKGIMICGYEYGDSNLNKNVDSSEFNNDATYTFFDKSPRFKNKLHSPYDQNIKKWILDLWEINTPPIANFEKYFIQTNWARGAQRQKREFAEYETYDNNFIKHLTLLKPSVILFFGNELASNLNRIKNRKEVIDIIGKEVKDSISVQHHITEDDGSPCKCTKFNIKFFYFEHCKVVVFPNAGGARGLSDKYFASFKNEMKEILSNDIFNKQ